MESAGSRDLSALLDSEFDSVVRMVFKKITSWEGHRNEENLPSMPEFQVVLASQWWKMQVEDYLYQKDLHLPLVGEKPEAMNAN
ncbi:hypothetical protein RJ640_013181 [Escallonia rubra]|uniref:Uncharacterized protein n=1 Tax=Escallonia rubra TaxID=112253 RepID=A0AA88UWN2_9ASTE|nr:hypothetical protein RJ640_013181 [Escallonia rubra]